MGSRNIPLFPFLNELVKILLEILPGADGLRDLLLESPDFGTNVVEEGVFTDDAL